MTTFISARKDGEIHASGTGENHKFFKGRCWNPIRHERSTRWKQDLAGMGIPIAS